MNRHQNGNIMTYCRQPSIITTKCHHLYINCEDVVKSMLSFIHCSVYKTLSFTELDLPNLYFCGAIVVILSNTADTMLLCNILMKRNIYHSYLYYKRCE